MLLEQNDVPNTEELSSSESQEAAPSQDASSDSSSEAQETQTQQKTEAEPPFHTHPRFQELVAQRKEAQEQARALQKQLQELSQKVNGFETARSKEQTNAKYAQLFDRLKGIDPEFHGFVSGLYSEMDAMKGSLSELNELRAWRAQQEASSVQEKAMNMRKEFYTQHKIPAERQKLYEGQLRYIAESNPHLTVNDLPEVLKQVQEEIDGMFKTVERSTTQKYVAGKKQEAAKPGMPKGAPAMNKDAKKPLTNRELAAEAVRLLRADKD